MKYWEIIADNLKQHGWSLGWVSAVDSQQSGLLTRIAATKAFRRARIRYRDVIVIATATRNIDNC
jgi:hypothetical protein